MFNPYISLFLLEFPRCILDFMVAEIEEDLALHRYGSNVIEPLVGRGFPCGGSSKMDDLGALNGNLGFSIVNPPFLGYPWVPPFRNPPNELLEMDDLGHPHLRKSPKEVPTRNENGATNMFYPSLLNIEIAWNSWDLWMIMDAHLHNTRYLQHQTGTYRAKWELALIWPLTMVVLEWLFCILRGIMSIVDQYIFGWVGTDNQHWTWDFSPEVLRFHPVPWFGAHDTNSGLGKNQNRS